MKALYVALLTSEKLLEELRKSSGKNPGYAGQKFNRLIIEGLKTNGVCTEAFSSVPVSRKVSKKIFWTVRKEVENDICYHYIPFINIPVIHNICLLIYSFFYILFWGIGKRKERFIIIDILNVSICMGALFACKLNGLKCVGVVTDMPGISVGINNESKSIKLRLLDSFFRLYTMSFDSYVFLTEQMNEALNPKHRPYIVMEGLCDSKITPENPKVLRSTLFSFMYAGGLYSGYGLETLINAFMGIKKEDARLVLYGSGPYEEEIRKYAEKDKRIIFNGVVPNQEIMIAETETNCLVNPRHTNELFTQYSFPSKNIEYMSSGRPLLTTKLPGMPKEYYPYVYLFSDETVKGYQTALIKVMSLSEEELSRKGYEAQCWVLRHKNNVNQTLRIIDLVKSII